MNAVAIEHVTLDGTACRSQRHLEHDTRVTVRIEKEAETATPPALADNPLFGMWQDRGETADVQAFARELRAPRYNIDGSRRGE